MSTDLAEEVHPRIPDSAAAAGASTRAASEVEDLEEVLHNLAWAADHQAQGTGEGRVEHCTDGIAVQDTRSAVGTLREEQTLDYESVHHTRRQEVEVQPAP